MASTPQRGFVVSDGERDGVAIGNYLNRAESRLVLRESGNSGITDQAFRRTFATYFERYGSVKDPQSGERH